MTSPNSKAWASAATVVLMAVLARLTGIVGMPTEDLLTDALMTLGTCLAGGVVGFATTWFAPKNAEK